MPPAYRNQLEDAEQALLKKLPATACSDAKQLVAQLKNSGVDEDLARAAMWDLIDRKQIDLTEDWHIRRRR